MWATARALLVALLLGATARADRTIVGFRLRKDPLAPVRGWGLDFDDKGFAFERFGSGGRQFIPWEELVDEDALALKKRFHLAGPGEVVLPKVPGHRLHLKGGITVEGVLIRVDADGRHWLKSAGTLLPYPKDRVEEVEELDLAEAVVYDEREAYYRRLNRSTPRTALEHKDLADHMFEIGNLDKARLHYEEACSLRPEWRAGLRERFAEIEELLADSEAAEVFRKARYEAFYNGRHDLARERIEEFVRDHPESRRRGLRFLDDLAANRDAYLRRAYHRVKAEELDRAVRRFLERRKPGIREAMDFATERLPEEIGAAVRSRLGIDDLDSLQGTEAGGAPHWATYWTGSFVVDKRGKGDPDRWWRSYDDVATRATWLKAYAAERLPELFEVVQVRTTPCDRCAGKGQVRKMAFRSAEGPGRNEWMERCPRCSGAGEDRGVGYR